MTMPQAQYAMESSGEIERLERKTDPAVSREQLLRTGLVPGMYALDAGAGTGAVAREMARLVGDGRVVAADASGERIAEGRRLAEREGLSNLSFEKHDLHEDGLGEERFDYVWCRFVFEYLRWPERALEQLVTATRPGGRIVIGDLDRNGLLHYPIESDLAADLERFRRALDGMIDLDMGRKLFAFMRRAGVTDIRVHILPYNVYAGAAPAPAIENWQQKFRTVRSQLAPSMGGTRAYDELVARYIALLEAPDTFSYSILVLCEGRRQ
jgi:SAM-dependent methyltransferase